jgi:lipoyl(octanoyl) transferase
VEVIAVRRFGRVEYGDGLELQRRFQEARRAGTVGDTLMLLEHNPVITLGRAAKQNNVLADAATLEAKGVELHETDRGGDVTFHGPGQITGYLLFHLGPGKQDVRKYVRNVEEIVIRACAALGVTVHREPKWPGVWVKDSKLGGLRKIGAVGVHLSRWYTRHGFALNVNTDLSLFDLIVPCGIKEAGVTSLAAELGRSLPLAEVEALLAKAAGEAFADDITEATADLRTISVVPVRADGQVLLLKRTEARGGFWQPVTGRIEAGESAEAAARRELLEETGIDARVEALDYVHSFGWGAGEKPIVCEETAFLVRVPQDAKVRLAPEEHELFKWCPTHEALDAVPYAGLRAAIRRAVTRPSALGTRP